MSDCVPRARPVPFRPFPLIDRRSTTPCSRCRLFRTPKTRSSPVISANTLSFHYGKHHKAYVDNLNKLAKGTEYESAPLEKVIRDTAGKADKAGLFNNAAQVWNHTFYWNCLQGRRRRQADRPHRADDRVAISAATTISRRNSRNACVTQFGSGWGWLVAEGGKLKIVKTPNAENAVHQGRRRRC